MPLCSEPKQPSDAQAKAAHTKQGKLNTSNCVNLYRCIHLKIEFLNFCFHAKILKNERNFHDHI